MSEVFTITLTSGSPVLHRLPQVQNAGRLLLLGYYMDLGTKKGQPYVLSVSGTQVTGNRCYALQGDPTLATGQALYSLRGVLLVAPPSASVTMLPEPVPVIDSLQGQNLTYLKTELVNGLDGTVPAASDTGGGAPLLTAVFRLDLGTDVSRNLNPATLTTWQRSIGLLQG